MKKIIGVLFTVLSINANAEINQIDLARVLAEGSSSCTFVAEILGKNDPISKRVMEVADKAQRISITLAETNGLPATFTQDSSISFVKSISPMYKSDRKMFIGFVSNSCKVTEYAVNKILDK